MPHTKPYPRVFIPMKDKEIVYNGDYLNDPRYVDKQEAASYINAARILVKDYYDLMDYVEPVDANKAVFSHRIYELLLRTATEFEANCKGILKANGYCKKGNLDIRDYYKINTLMKLDQYVISSSLWNPEKTICPLFEWASGPQLTWFQAYNKAKHNRYHSFKEASLENLFVGICSLITILAAQFPYEIGDLSADKLICTTEETNKIYIGGFTITYPHFDENESYAFSWEQLKSDPQPFERYLF